MRRMWMAAGVLAAGLMASQAQAGLLKDLDTLMNNYANNVIATGDNVRKNFSDPFSLKSWDAMLQGYSNDVVKTGDDALKDIKAVTHDLLDIKTYLPGPLKAAWEAMVKEIAVLHARFLWRCDHPWADDPPAGGGGAASPPSDVVFVPDQPAPPAAPAPAPAPAPAVVSPPPPPAASGAATGALPAAASATAAGAIALTDGDMSDELDSFVNYRKTAQRAYQWMQGLDGEKQAAIKPKVGWMITQAHLMEDKLAAKVCRNPHFFKVFVDYVGRLDHPTAKGSFGDVLSKVGRQLNGASIGSASAASSRTQAGVISGLRARINQ